MGAPKGNTYWKLANNPGKPRSYMPDTLLEKALEYFEWVDNNPLKEQKAFAYKGEVTVVELNKMRAMTLTAFCLFANITMQTFFTYEKQKEYSEVTSFIKNHITTQKFEGASADLLNANIISRDLGLVDRIKSEVDVVEVSLPDEN